MTESQESRPRPEGRAVPALGLFGAALLIAGTFAPVGRAPTGAAVSYLDAGGADGNLMIGLGVASFVLTWVLHWYRGLGATGGLALLLLAAGGLRPPRGVTFGAGTEGWGWAVMFAGVVSLLSAALLAQIRRPKDEEPTPE